MKAGLECINYLEEQLGKFYTENKCGHIMKFLIGWFDFTAFQHFVLKKNKPWSLLFDCNVMRSTLVILRGFSCITFSIRGIIAIISKIHRRPTETVSIPMNYDWLSYISRLIFAFGYQPLFALLLKFICHFSFSLIFVNYFWFAAVVIELSCNKTSYCWYSIRDNRSFSGIVRSYPHYDVTTRTDA